MSANRFSRGEILYGNDFQKIVRAKVVVCGAGAVGSFALEALARTGVGNFLIIDFDKVECTNINRQLIALESTIGKSKAQLASSRILDINPDAKVEVLETFINVQNLNLIFDYQPDIVVDAIDSTDAKIALLRECAKRNLTVVSSMGAARKLDIFSIRRGDIFDTRVCPLASRIRKELRRAGVARGKIQCVFSDELPSADTHIISKDKIIGSCAHLTGAFGLALAQLALECITGKFFAKK